MNLPKAPSLMAEFQMGNNEYSVYGTDDQGNSSFHTLNLRSTYQVVGLTMTGSYSQGGNHSLIPEVVSGENGSQIQSDFDGFGFGVSRRLPLEGSISGNVNRSSWNTYYQGSDSTGSIDTANVFTSMRPTEKLTVSGSVEYSDNLAGQLVQAVAGTGAAIPGFTGNEASNSLQVEAFSTYVPTSHMQTTLFYEHRAQLFQSEDYGVDSFGGGASYTERTREGTVNASLSVVGNRSEQNGADTLGFSATGNYANVLDGWHVNGSFGYAQDMQTLLVTYLNSSYNFSGNIRRKFGKLSFSAGGGGSKTGLTDQPGTSSSSESYNAGIGYSSWINANGSYSQSNGLALATGAGLLPVPVPVPVLPSNLLTLYGGTSYSYAVSSAPVRGLTISGSFARSDSSTSEGWDPVFESDRGVQFVTPIPHSQNRVYQRLCQVAAGLQPVWHSPTNYIDVLRWGVALVQFLLGRRRCFSAVLILLAAVSPRTSPAAQKAKPPAAPSELWVMSLDGGRKLTWERSFKSESEVKPNRGFWTKVVDVIAGAPEYRSLVRPYSIAVDSRGRILVTDPGAQGVHIFDFVQRKYKFIQRIGKTNDSMLTPQCVAVDDQDNIYVTDSGAGMIFVFEPSGKYLRTIGKLKGWRGLLQEADRDRCGLGCAEDLSRVRHTARPGVYFGYGWQDTQHHRQKR